MITWQLSQSQLDQLDLRSVSRLVNVASRYNSSVYVCYNRGRVHMGSLIGMLALPSLSGSDYVLEVDGDDEQNAMNALMLAWNGE